MAYLGMQSVVRGDSSKCVCDIFTLHFPDARTVGDLTFGKGRFWKWVEGDTPYVVGLDADPSGGAHIQSDYRHVPLKDQSVDVAVFDPPFIFTSGIQRITGAKRFFLGAGGREIRFSDDARVQRPKGPSDLMAHTVAVFHEAERIARQGLILKGQNLIVNKPFWWTFRAVKAGLEMLSLYPEDELIQISPAPRLHDPRWKNQFHLRRAHCYYLIYRWG